jgi:hypothetical protein
MTVHRLTTLATCWRLAAEPIGHRVDFSLQRCQQTRTVFDFHFALQQQET